MFVLPTKRAFKGKGVPKLQNDNIFFVKSKNCFCALLLQKKQTGERDKLVSAFRYFPVRLSDPKKKYYSRKQKRAFPSYQQKT